MAELLLRVLLPMGLAGGLFFLLLQVLRPLTARLHAAHRRALLLATALLFALPLPLLLPTSTPASTPVVASAQAQPTPLQESLRTLPPTAPVYAAGNALGSALSEASAPATPGQPGTRPWQPTPAQICGFIWLAGLSGVLAVQALRYLMFMRRLRRSCIPAEPGPDLTLYTHLCNEMRFSRPPRLYYSALAGAPMLAGLLRPRIILPTLPLQPGQTAFALRHELTHHRAGDLLFKMLLQLLCALHWFNPAAWLLRAAFAQACEENCDEQVAARLNPADRRAYAAALLACAGPAPRWAVSAFASPAGRLRRRLSRLLSPTHPSRPLRAACAALLLVALATCLLAGCALAAGSAGSSLPGTGNAPSSTPENTDLSSAHSPPPDASPSLPAVSNSLAPSSSKIGADSDTPVTDLSQTDSPTSLTDIDPAAPSELLCPAPGATTLNRSFVEGTHRGADFIGEVGTPILAAAAGTVLEAGWHWSWGHHITLQHGDERLTLYAHCDTLLVETGDTVTPGQEIATMGSTGSSFGPHLHFEVLLPTDAPGEPDEDLPELYQAWAPTDPLPYLTLPDGMKVYTTG